MTTRILPEDFVLPRKILIDPKSGLALNVPAAYQGEPFWWEDGPRYNAFLEARKAAGVKEILDFPDGKPVKPAPIQHRPMGTRLARMKKERESRE